jgi:uncharacterized membrane protein
MALSMDRNSKTARILAIAASAGLVSAIGWSAPVAAKHKFITFDPPGSANTQPLSMNNFGDVVGRFQDSKGKTFGFIRNSVDGFVDVVEFNNQQESTVNDINDDQALVGAFTDDKANLRCFVRKTNHKFVFCVPPGASTSEGIAMNNQLHNGAGVVTGFWTDANEQEHAFVWDGGVATEFDVPGSRSTGAPMDINDSGTVTGTWSDAGDGTAHGFIRTADGKITTFDPPGCDETIPEGINSAGAIVGLCHANKGFHSFLLNPDGTSKIFDPPGVSDSDAFDINKKGAITGQWTDDLGVDHGYLRSPKGKIQTIDVPHAFLTDANAINDSGAITGDFTLKHGGAHGFLRLP